MKNFTCLAATTAALIAFNALFSQTHLAGFDDLNLETNSYWIGSTHGSNDFTSGFANFSHFYDATYYSWNGFVYSNIVDTVTPGWGNQYACRAGIGADNTDNYGVYYQWGNDSVWFDTITELNGLFITNSTYAALSMEFGDAYSKKFGGETGDDPDWFLLTITGYDEVGNETGIVEYYLTDYRFENNAEDYIVTDWEWVDLTLLYEVKTLKFSLTSSDNGDWGMNTPAYFCLDEIKSVDNSNVISFNKSEFGISVYPNPFLETIFIESEEKGKIQISNINGQVVYRQIIENSEELIDLSSLEKGIYFLTVYSTDGLETRKIIKQ